MSKTSRSNEGKQMAKKLSYLDMLRQRYPKVNATDEWVNGRYCPLNLFNSDTIDIPDASKVICDNFRNSFATDEDACKACWDSICPNANKCHDSENKDFNKEYYTHYPKEAKENVSSEPITPNSSENQIANSIVYINANEIEAHPDNPRKDVGDVSELAKSIKRDGIRQNLTVIPYKQGYRCLIRLQISDIISSCNSDINCIILSGSLSSCVGVNAIISHRPQSPNRPADRPQFRR